MIINLNISINNTEGALIRILGTIERRGHKLLDLRSRVSSPGDDFQKLLVDINCGERSPDVLMRQLDRLHDVISISRHGTCSAPNRSPRPRLRFLRLLSDLRLPEMTRRMLMRPAKGSAKVLNT